MGGFKNRYIWREKMKKAFQILLSVLIVGYLVVTAFFVVNSINGNFRFTENKDVSEVVEIDHNVAFRNELVKIISDYVADKDGEWSVYVKNLNNGMSVEINNTKVPAASLIKLFNMVTLYNEVNIGNVEITPSLSGALNQMITVSSNYASNDIVEIIGKGNFERGASVVNELVKNMGCTATAESHRLYSEIIPDTVGVNTTSVKDCGLILEKIYKRECIGNDYDVEMLELLKEQGRNTKLSLGLPSGTLFAHKTGENSKLEADVGIVFSPSCDYIICVAVTEYGNVKPRNEIGELSKCVYEFFNN